MDEISGIGSVGPAGGSQPQREVAQSTVAAAPPPQAQVAQPPAPGGDRAAISGEAREARHDASAPQFVSAFKATMRGPQGSEPQGPQAAEPQRQGAEGPQGREPQRQEGQAPQAADKEPQGLRRGEGLGAGQKASDQVRSLQRDLKARGFDIGRSGADGRFGGDTEAALKAAQKKLGLPQTGVADAGTLDALGKMPASGTGRKARGADKAEEAAGGHRPRATAYFPHDSAMEGGHKEAYPGKDGRIGAVNTIDDWNSNRHWDLKSQSYKEGRPDYVTVAGDPRLKGKNLTIDQFPGVPFRVMDTGGRFQGTGWNRLDIAVGSHDASFRTNTRRSHEDTFNRRLTVREAE